MKISTFRTVSVWKRPPKLIFFTLNEKRHNFQSNGLFSFFCDNLKFKMYASILYIFGWLYTKKITRNKNPWVIKFDIAILHRRIGKKSSIITFYIVDVEEKSKGLKISSLYFFIRRSHIIIYITFPWALNGNEKINISQFCVLKSQVWVRVWSANRQSSVCRWWGNMQIYYTSLF